MTHYIPPFTKEQGVRVQQAACGRYIHVSDHASEPTCPRCKAWCEKDAEESDDPVARFGPSPT